MNKKIARITQDKKLLLANEVVEDNAKTSLSEHGKLYIKNILEGNKFSIDDEFIEVGEFIEGYPFVKPVIDDSLVLWLDGSTGNNYEKTNIWKDLSGNGNDGQLINFDYNENSGWVDGGLRFDGVDDYIHFRDRVSVDSPTFTVICTLTVFEDKRNSLFYDGEKVKIDIYGNSLNVRGDYSVMGDAVHFGDSILNRKIFIALTFNGEKRKAYLDGRLIQEINKQSDNDTFSIRRIGSYTTGTNGNFKLYDIKLYNRALTDEEIMQNYKAGQCSPLLAMRGEVIG